MAVGRRAAMTTETLSVVRRARLRSTRRCVASAAEENGRRVSAQSRGETTSQTCRKKSTKTALKGGVDL